MYSFLSITSLNSFSISEFPKEANPILEEKGSEPMKQPDKMFKVFSRPQLEDNDILRFDKVAAYIKENNLDEEIISQKTINDFNTCYFCKEGNRRGAGFDKPQLGKSGPTCGCASMKSFGHTGFTGTMAWADPENDLIYVFLSNRTFPNADDNKLSKANTREDIQQVIYDALNN